MASARAVKGVPPAYIRMDESGEHATSSGPAPRKPMVPRTFDFTPLLLRQIFHRAERVEKSAKVHVVLFHRCMRRLFDLFDPQFPLELETLGCPKGAPTVTWKDVRTAIDDERFPKVQLNCFQSIFLIMEDYTSSWLGLFWYMICNVVIIANVVAIIVLSYPGVDHHLEKDGRIMMDWCAYLFMFDYLLKASTVIYCPIAMHDEEYLLECVLPSGEKDRGSTHSLQNTKCQRFWYWALTGSNVIDFLSILPNLMNVLLQGFHVPLSSLRMLRLLRVLRLLKAFKAVGKWVITLQVIGDAMYMSLGSLLVIILYIALFSLVAGAVLYQQEGDEVYSDVPNAMGAVSEIFIGKCWSASSTFLSAVVLAGVGIFKGIIFLLPIERMKVATKVAEEKYAEKQKLQAQVDEEARRLDHAGTEWASSFLCPSARFEVFPDASGNSMVPAIGMLNLPTNEKEPVEAVVCVPLSGGTLQRIVGPRPTVEFFVKWRPSAKAARGTLTVQVLKGQHFNSSNGTRWRVRMQAPNLLQEAPSWLSAPSDGKGPHPEWSEVGVSPPPEGTFKIFPIVDEEVHFDGEENKAVHNEQAFRKRVLEMLEDQSRRISALEAQHCQAMKLWTWGRCA